MLMPDWRSWLPLKIPMPDYLFPDILAFTDEHSTSYSNYNISISLVWTCRVNPVPLLYSLFKCRNAAMSGIWSFQYRNKKKCWCQNQSSTAIRGLSLVPECYGTGLRSWMPECRCQRHCPLCRCPAMLYSSLNLVKSRMPHEIIKSAKNFTHF